MKNTFFVTLKFFHVKERNNKWVVNAIDDGGRQADINYGDSQRRSLLIAARVGN